MNKDAAWKKTLPYLAAAAGTAAEYSGFNPMMTSLDWRDSSKEAIGASALMNFLAAEGFAKSKNPALRGAALLAGMATTPIMMATTPALEGLHQSKKNLEKQERREKFRTGLALAGLAGAGILGSRAVSKMNQPAPPEQGEVLLTLPTRDPNDVETQVRLPLSSTRIPTSALQGVERDIKRKLRAEAAERKRTRRSNKPPVDVMSPFTLQKTAAEALEELCIKRATQQMMAPPAGQAPVQSNPKFPGIVGSGPASMHPPHIQPLTPEQGGVAPEQAMPEGPDPAILQQQADMDAAGMQQTADQQVAEAQMSASQEVSQAKLEAMQAKMEASQAKAEAQLMKEKAQLDAQKIELAKLKSDADHELDSKAKETELKDFISEVRGRMGDIDQSVKSELTSLASPVKAAFLYKKAAPGTQDSTPIGVPTNKGTRRKGLWNRISTNADGSNNALGSFMAGDAAKGLDKYDDWIAQGTGSFNQARAWNDTRDAFDRFNRGETGLFGGLTSMAGNALKDVGQGVTSFVARPVMQGAEGYKTRVGIAGDRFDVAKRRLMRGDIRGAASQIGRGIGDVGKGTLNLATGAANSTLNATGLGGLARVGAARGLGQYAVPGALGIGGDMFNSPLTRQGQEFAGRYLGQNLQQRNMSPVRNMAPPPPPGLMNGLMHQASNFMIPQYAGAFNMGGQQPMPFNGPQGQYLSQMAGIPALPF